MPIPRAERVAFSNNPLVEVVTQLAYPRLLEIDAELPVKFQKLVQADYPILSAGKVLEVQFDEKGAETRAPEGRRYEFFSADRKWQAVLTSEFIALTTSQYIGWEDFKTHASKIVSAFLDCYRPAYFSRIGLRYRDTISRSRLGLKGVPWHQLLQPHILGALSAGALNERELIGCRTSFALKLENSAKVQVNHGLLATESDDPEYVIDSDFFQDQPTQADLDAAIRILENFRPHTGNLFHWCITKQLSDAMGPKPIRA
jgi:uncharacterized protein (TIGR04255 family)